MKKYYLSLVLLIVLAFAFLASGKTAPVSACSGGNCFEELCSGNIKFPFPPGFFPTLLPCRPTPTPTTPPGGGGEPTPTPTLPPGVTPTPTTTQSSGGGPGDGGGPGPQGGAGCPNTSPIAPTLLSVSRTGHEATINWTSVLGADHYVLSYGVSSGNYSFGVPDVGNTTSFTVGGLDPAQNYCFAVAAANGCASSPLSGGKCLNEGQVLGVSTGQVLGLSDTSGGNDWELVFKLLAVVWVLIGLKAFALRK